MPAALPFAAAGASIYSSYQQGKAAKEAARASADASNYAADLQNDQYLQSREDLAPYRHIGVQALNQLGSLYGFSPYQAANDAPAASPAATATPADVGAVKTAQATTAGPLGDRFSATGGMGSGAAAAATNYLLSKLPQETTAPAATAAPAGATAPVTTPAATPAGGNGMAGFFASPDYNFRLEEGNRALARRSAASGMITGGAFAKELSRFNQGQASQEFGNYFNRLASLAGIGQSATNQTGTFGANAATNAGQFAQNAGDARASGYIGRANALNAGINGVASAFGGYGSNGGGGIQTQPLDASAGGWNGYNALNAGGNFAIGR